MKLFYTIVFLALGTSLLAQRVPADKIEAMGGELVVQPISHATMVLSFKNQQIYIDPTGGAEAFAGVAAPDLIIITDIHGDHFDLKTIEAINTNKAKFIVPQAVADKMTISDKSKIMVMANGESSNWENIGIAALPMYNLPESADARHTKGRGNGYVLTIGGKRVYISGDTEAIPEMRALKNIDVAFVCMNLPYTMDVNQAAEGVLAFNPKMVYPYHYRGQDTNKFKELVNAGNNNIDVRLRDWYAK